MPDQIAAFFDRLSARDTPILTDISGGERRSITGRDLTNHLDRMASCLAETGLDPGERAIAVFDNTLESALVLLTALRHGFTLCLQPAGTAAAELQQLQADLAAKSILNATRLDIEGTTQITLDQLAACRRLAPQPVAPRTPFTITFTSGSTGTPKGIVHSAESFLNCAEAFNHQSGISDQDRFLNVMPMFYMAGIFNGILAPLMAGASVVIAEAFNTATALRFWPTIAAQGISALWLSPTMLSLVSRLDRTDKTVPPSLRRLFIGTGAMARTDAEQFFQTYGLPPLQSYGLSELLYISVDDAGAPSFGTVGRPLKGVALDHGAETPLSITSPYAFLGYLVDGALQPHEGGFTTSDLAALSEGGVLSILGRSDDIILRGGVNVNPVELEAALATAMAGRAFCISSLKDDMLGQKIVLVTEGAPLPEADLAAARAIIRDHPGRAQLDGVMQVPKLPVGPTGKIRRAALRALLSEEQG